MSQKGHKLTPPLMFLRQILLKSVPDKLLLGLFLNIQEDCFKILLFLRLKWCMHTLLLCIIIANNKT